MSGTGGRMLVLGGSGYVGRRLAAALGPERCVATCHAAPAPGCVPFDALRDDVSALLPEGHGVSHAVVLLGDTNPVSCARTPLRARTLNVERTTQILRGLAARGVVPVFLSSDYVFDGRRGGYVEVDPVAPLVTYGWHKAEVERFLREELDHWVVVRTAKVYDTQPDDPSLLAGWARALLAGNPVECAEDQCFSPTLADDLVRGILRLAETDARGVYHVCGPRGHRRIDLLHMLLERLEGLLDARPVVRTRRINEFGLPEPWPVDTSLRPDKAVRELQLDPTPVEAAMDALAARLREQRQEETT
jgi:dTDP-4-dehydrorhamnose reductase